MSDSGTGGDLPGWALGFLLLTVTIGGAGFLDYVLTNAGYPNLGVFVWVVCYSGALIAVWMIWLRHIELTGPAEG